MATTFNAKMQPLQVFRLGLPGDTLTQEGLAIMAEYHSGYLSHARLQALAVRVLAVDSLLKEHNFYQTFCFLTDELQLERDDAFIITTRVYRGGGFTKDYVYLKGFLAMLDLSKQRSLDNLMIGKCSHRYLDLIDELVERGWLTQPRHRIPQHQGDIEPTLAYLIRSLKH